MIFRILGEWPNVYTFTMNIVEDMLKSKGKADPISIIRPSLGKKILKSLDIKILSLKWDYDNSLVY